ncbi:hypothetical protein ACFW1F_25980 [Streptomyces bungoensis]|uniref:hypothetical protein n=1 Tax=Streptomyces bungoensis TaxID=285568 RepID=UPI0036ABBEDB
MSASGWVALGTVSAITLIPGGAAVLGGWLLPRLRDRVQSPRIWGLGLILVGLGLSIEVLDAHRPDSTLRNTIGLAGLYILICGFCVKKWARGSVLRQP